MTTAWYDERNRLTPEELKTVTFPLSRLGRRGFEEEAVREFMNVVHDEFVRLMNERASLWQEVQRLRRRIIAGKVEGENGNGSGTGRQQRPVRAVRRVRRPRARGADPVDGADHRRPVRGRRPGVQQPGDQGGHAAPGRDHAGGAAVLRHDLGGGTRAGQRGCGLGAQQRPAGPASSQERAAAQAELAYLRTYSEVYRAHLRAYTEGVLRGIEEWEAKETASLEDAARSLPMAAAPVLTNGTTGKNGRPQLHK